jgi:gliding motility-associated-like protein
MFVSLFCCATTQAQVIKHSYRFFNNFSASSIECGPDLEQVQAEGNCNGEASPGSFITDNLSQCGVTRTVYHTNMHWGLRYPNTSNIITNTYTIHLYVKNTDFGNRSWARIIDFSNGALDEGIYYKSDGSTGGRCLDFYPSGIVGACPFFDASTYYLLTFTRNGATGIVDVYVNNTKFVSYNDAAGRYTGKPGTPIYIYRDDRSVSCESGAANIAFLSFTNQYATQGEVTSVYNDICSIANTDNSADFSFSKNPVCNSGEDVQVTYTGDLVPPASGFNFSWDWDGGMVKSGTGMGPFVVNWKTPGTKNVKLTISSTTCGGSTNSSSKTQQLQVNNKQTTILNKTICQGQNFEGYATSGTYTDRFSTPSGCDSLRTLHLTVAATITTVVNKTICPGQSFEGYNKEGTYTDTYTSASGCDSIRTLHLTVTGAIATSVKETMCSGSLFILPSGRKVGQGIYTERLSSASGCDSMVTYTIEEKDVKQVSLHPVICTGSAYTLPSGRVLTVGGNYIDTLRYTSGCDSLITQVNLTILPLTRKGWSATICAGTAYTLPSGKSVHTAGTYMDTLRNGAGCDSMIATITLSVQAAYQQTIAASICAGQAYTLPSGKIVSTGGTFREAFTSAAGCDSVITTVLTVSQMLRSTTHVSICAGQSYQLPSGRMVNAAGTYEEKLPTAGGCDSIVTTVIAVVQQVRTSTEAAICSGSLYTLPSGKRVPAGVYADTLTTTFGCDSIVTITVLEKSLKKDTVQVSLCNGATFRLPSGKLIGIAGTYSDTVRYTTGCDSLITTAQIRISNAVRRTVSAAVCFGETYTLPSGRIAAVSGVYYDSLKNATGCDSIIVTTVTVKEQLASAHKVRTCSGSTYTLPSGRVVDQPGIYTDRFQTPSGCDSLVTTDLAVTNVIPIRVDATVCANKTYKLPLGQVVQLAGTYTDTLKSKMGCDSVVVTHLSFAALPTATHRVAICAASSWRLPSGKTVSVAGNYIDTVTNGVGCDSIITTVLTILRVQRQQLTAQVCAGQAYRLPSGRQISQAGNYEDTVRSALGCDSIITSLSLEVAQPKRAAVQHAMCQGKTYRMPSGKLLATSGNYSDTLRNQWGCDTLITSVNLTVTPRNAFGVHISKAQVCAGEQVQLQAYGGERYRWLSTAGIQDLAAPAQQVQPTGNTTYRVIIYNETCSQEDTVTAVVVVHANPLVSVVKSNDVNCNLGSAQLRASGGATYQWSPAEDLTSTQGAQVTVAPKVTTTYQVTATSAKGCTATASVQVLVTNEGTANLPNAFTPDGDGLNDCFGVRSWGVVKNFQFRVYGRWGNLVFQTSDPAQCWDGTYKGQKLEPGTYVYQIAGTTHCGPVFRKGTVTIVR